MSFTETVQQSGQLLDKITHRLESSDRMDRYRSSWVLALGRVY